MDTIYIEMSLWQEIIVLILAIPYAILLISLVFDMLGVFDLLHWIYLKLKRK